MAGKDTAPWREAKAAYDFVHNVIHIHIVMKLYALRAKFDSSRVIWAFYTADDLRNKAEWMRDRLQLERAAVLDLGCGTGVLLQPFMGRGHALTGVDLDVSIAKQACPEGQFVAQDLLEFLESQSRAFDLIIMHGVIGCFPLDKQSRILRKCIDHLTPGGTLWLGATQYEGDHYVFYSYPMNEAFLQQIVDSKPVSMEIHNEWALFGQQKYSRDQRTVLLRKR